MAAVQKNALLLLRGIYDETKGDRRILVRTGEVARKIGMDTSSAHAAFHYLVEKHLIEDSREMAELPTAFITASGIDAIEDATCWSS